MNIKEEDKEYIEAADDCFSEALYQFQEGIYNVDAISIPCGIDKGKMQSVMDVLRAFCESFNVVKEVVKEAANK